MFDGNICSDNKKYGGFGQTCCVIRRNTPQVHDVLWRWPALRPHPPRQLFPHWAHLGLRSPPPVAVAEHIWLTKRPYKRQKKTLQPAVAPAPTAAPAPTSLVGVDEAAAGAPAEKKPTTVLPPVPVAALVPLSFNKPIHLGGILVEIVGTTVSCQRAVRARSTRFAAKCCRRTWSCAFANCI